MAQFEHVYYLGTERTLGHLAPVFAGNASLEVIDSPLDVYRWQEPDGSNTVKLTNVWQPEAA
jgi:hypothetical protein